MTDRMLLRIPMEIRLKRTGPDAFLASVTLPNQYTAYAIVRGEDDEGEAVEAFAEAVATEYAAGRFGPRTSG